MKNIYLDYAATTPVDPRILEYMQPYFTERFANPSSAHFMGRHIKEDVEAARCKVADMLSCTPQEIIFTSGGTEAENLAIKGIAFSAKKHGKHIVISSVEHHAVEGSVEYLEKKGFEVTRVPVDSTCTVNTKALKEAIREDTILVSVMLVNNEIGTIQPIQDISDIVKKENESREKNGTHPIRLHTDAEAAAFYIEPNVQELGVDALTINGSKMYCPKGIGALYIKSGVSAATQIAGGGQEGMVRGGTENVPGIIALGEAVVLAAQERETNNAYIGKVRNALISEVQMQFPDARLNTPDHSVVNIVHFTFPSMPQNVDIIKLLSQEGVALSQGSACSSNEAHPPHVLPAVGFTKEEMNTSIRFSLGKQNTVEDIHYAVGVLSSILKG